MVQGDPRARPPLGEEQGLVKFDDYRVGKDSGKGYGKQPSQWVGLHERSAPEVFAIDDSPKAIPVVGRRTDGIDMEAIVLVPHPYPSLNMKIKTANV